MHYKPICDYHKYFRKEKKKKKNGITVYFTDSFSPEIVSAISNNTHINFSAISFNRSQDLQYPKNFEKNVITFP